LIKEPKYPFSRTKSLPYPQQRGYRLANVLIGSVNAGEVAAGAIAGVKIAEFGLLH